jgi:uncharacterized protein DUF4357
MFAVWSKQQVLKMKAQNQATTIKLFLVKGDPKGLRTAELSNWTGKAISAPRTELTDLYARKELHGPGIYFLTGTDPNTGAPAVYIGEAEDVLSRIKGHSDKDFWTSITSFISKDDNLTKAHIRYLEGKLIERASNNSRIEIVNASNSSAKLPEPETAEMDAFLERVLQLLPVLGVNHFNEFTKSDLKDQDIMLFSIKGLKARGKRTASGFVVFKDSQAVPEHRPSAKAIKNIREELIEKKILTQVKDHFVFTKDYEFGSPSTAGGVVCGGNTNGLKNWKNSRGKSLKEIEDSLI